MKTNKVLSIIIPCYNEKNTIEEIVDRVLASPIDNKEIIVVDNCSTDGTKDILKNKIEQKVAKVIYRPENKGKGSSIRLGIDATTGDVIIFQDADLEYDPNEYPLLFNPIINGEADVVYGSRFMKVTNKGYLSNYLANRFLTFLSNLFTHQHLTDMETCYKAFRSDILKSISLEQDYFGIEPEVTSKITKKGIKIKEVPISYFPRTNKQGKKVNFKDGINTINCILKYK